MTKVLEKKDEDVKKNEKSNGVQMGAKIANQINSIQQSNMLLTYTCVITQSAGVTNINLG